MAARSLLLGLLAGAALALAGCAVRPKTCYVTLSAVGQPTAEACESGPVLIVRPITESNAAYYVPPYVLGALSYEGYVEPADESDQASGGTKAGAADAKSEADDDAGAAATPAAAGTATGASEALKRAIIRNAFLMPMPGESIPPLAQAFAPPLGEISAAASNGDTAEKPLALAGRAPAGRLAPSAERTAADRPPAPRNRIAPEHPRIDGEVRYTIPYEGVPAAPISPDLSL
ncbi:hypothetical protein [Jiella sonneratiae]|uniref:Lipoprotein n=1 Tax=Jiella sonneratiae TaxID=2816856 RepID=A0ABS3J2R7_9HYPH|nr:hypothetical protein [Jiella sonneratiae]MBO0903445.1 hypothetical protein [Jiella sonneratiae]